MTFKELSELIGENCRVIRKSKGLSQKTVVERMGKDRSADISELESGKSNPTLETISKLAEALEVDVLDLFKFEDLRHNHDIQKQNLKLKVHFEDLQNRSANELEYILNANKAFLDFLDKEKTTPTM